MECFSAILLFDAFSARKMKRFRHWIIVTSLAFLEATFLNIASKALPDYSKILIALVLYMETIVEGIVEKCIQNELIEESQRDWMTYSLQRKFMNFGGFFILVCFGALVAPLPQVILLNFGLAFLREKTNGLHMPTIFSCFITSLFCEYACLYLIDRLQSSTIAAAITLFIVSAMLILILAPCNNSAMHCSNEELRDMKIAVRKRLVLYCLIIPALLLLKPLYSTVWIVAAAADAFLLVLAKIGVGIK